MASKKKVEKQPTSKEIVEKEPVVINENDIIPEEEAKNIASEEVTEVKAPEVIVEKEKTEKKAEKKSEKAAKSIEKSPKYSVGSIVYVAKDAEADLNGFKLFPPYKKYTYTVEAYDAILGVYSLRRLNLSLKLKEANIVAPSERAHDSLNRRQF